MNRLTFYFLIPGFWCCDILWRIFPSLRLFLKNRLVFSGTPTQDSKSSFMFFQAATQWSQSPLVNNLLSVDLKCYFYNIKFPWPLCLFIQVLVCSIYLSSQFHFIPSICSFRNCFIIYSSLLLLFQNFPVSLVFIWVFESGCLVQKSDSALF